MEKEAQSQPLVLKKRPVFHSVTENSSNDILISRKRDTVIYLKRIHKQLFVKNQQEVRLKGVGAAILRTVEIALQCERTYPGLELVTETYTMPISDALHTTDGEFVEDSTRLSSAICITLKNGVPLFAQQANNKV